MGNSFSSDDILLDFKKQFLTQMDAEEAEAIALAMELGDVYQS